MKDKDTAAAILTVSSVLLLLTLVWDHPWSHGLLALLVGIFPIGLVYLATAGGRRGAVLRRSLLLLAVILCGSLLALVALDRGPTQVFLLGLPVTLWIMLAGLTLLPLVLVSWVYAVTFAAGEIDRRQEPSEPRATDGGAE
jgi:hypothetical protein